MPHPTAPLNRAQCRGTSCHRRGTQAGTGMLTTTPMLNRKSHPPTPMSPHPNQRAGGSPSVLRHPKSWCHFRARGTDPAWLTPLAPGTAKLREHDGANHGGQSPSLSPRPSPGGLPRAGGSKASAGSCQAPPHASLPPLPAAFVPPPSQHLRGGRIKATQSRAERRFGCNFLCSIIDKQAASRR